LIAVLLPVIGNRTLVTAPKDLLRCSPNTILNEFDTYFDRRVVIGERRRRSFGTVTWVRFPPTVKRTAIQTDTVLELTLNVH